MKKVISTIIVICLLFSAVSTMVYAEEDTSVSTGYINTINAKTNESASYKGICKNDTIYMLANDIATIGGYGCESLSIEKGTAENIIENSTILSKTYSKLNLEKLFNEEKFEYLLFSRKDTTTDYITQIYYYNGYAQTMSKSFVIDTVKYDGQTYLNLEKMLYLMHAQWCVEESFLYYYPLDYNIFDFIDKNFSYMYENTVQHNSLLYDGENKWEHSTRIVLSHILNDVDMRIFIPFSGSDVIKQDWYEEAILQLATTDDSFIDDYGSKQISNYLKDSPYHKIETGLSVTDTTLGAIKELPDKIADTKLNKFSKWNDFSTINTAQLDATQKKISTFGDIVSVANILVDFNEINTRSKEWGDDFVNGLNVLYTINEDVYGDAGKYILKVADNLLDEYEKPTEEAAEAAMIDTYGLVLDKLLDNSIIGRIESIISLSNVIIKSNPNCAEAIENADLMNTVHALVDVENVYLNEFVDAYHDYLHYLGVEDGTSSLRLFELMYISINDNPQKEIETHAISDMRNALEMFLKASLRNKTNVYHFNYFNNGGSYWTPTAEAKALEEDIYKTYALLSELISTRDYDKLLYLDETYDSMYSDEYGLIREKITADILSDYENESTNKISQSNYYDATGKLIYYENYAYYDNGLLCSTTLYSVDYMSNGAPYYSNIYTILYLYDKKGNLIDKRLDGLTISEWYDESSGEIILDYEDDANGNSTKVRFYPEKESIDQAKFGVDSSKTKEVYGNAPTITTDSMGDWAITYLDNVFADAEPTDVTECRLIYVDNDSIPELWIDYGYGYAGAEIYTQANGETDRVYISHGSAEWIEKNNILITSGGHQDVYSDEVFKIQDGKFISIGSGNFGARDNSNVQFDENNYPIYSYYWDNIKVTESEYENKLSSFFDRSKSVNIYQNIYTYNQCKLLLQSIAEDGGLLNNSESLNDSAQKNENVE